MCPGLGRDLWHLGNSRLEVVAVVVRTVGAAASIISLLKETGLLSWVSLSVTFFFSKSRGDY